MRSLHSNRAAALALGALLALMALMALTITAPPAYAEEAPLAELLQSVEREFDRRSLPAKALFRDEAGRLQTGVRCAARPVGDLERSLIAAAVDERLASDGAGHRKRAAEIPVAFHVLRRANGDWNVSDQEIERQMQVLNDSFAGSGLSFVLAGVNRRDKNRFAKKCYSAKVERRLKKRYAVDPTRTLNVYTCRPQMDILGFAYFPSDYPEDSFMHGVVVHHATLPGGSAAPYDLGDTLVHEAGHYFGLFHTFEGKCGGKGDRIDDTPAEKRPAYGCPTSRDTCPSPGADPVKNFMDYTDDACLDHFTPDQVIWMMDQIATFKPGLL